MLLNEALHVRAIDAGRSGERLEVSSVLLDQLAEVLALGSDSFWTLDPKAPTLYGYRP